MSFLQRLAALALVCLAACSSAEPQPAPPVPAKSVVLNALYREDKAAPGVLTDFAFGDSGEVLAMGPPGSVADRINHDTAVIDAQGRPAEDCAVSGHEHEDLPFLPQMLVSPVPGQVAPWQDFTELLAAVRTRAAEVLAAEKAAQDAGQPVPARLPIVGLTLFTIHPGINASGINVADALEAAAPGFFVYLFDVDGHGALHNWTAATLVGFNPNSPDPEGGRFGRDAAGRLDGHAHEQGAQVPFFRFVAAFIPFEVKVGQLNAFTSAAFAQGYCRTTDINFVDSVVVAEQVRAATAEPQAIVSACLPTDPGELANCKPNADGITILKRFIDGAFADGFANTDEHGDRDPALAYLNPETLPVHTLPWWGNYNLTDAQLDRDLAWVLADKAHRRLVLHAAGRGAIGQVMRRMVAVGGSLEAFRDVVTFEHVDLISPEQVAALGAAGMAVVLNTPHFDLYPVIQLRYPAAIVAQSQPLASLYRAGLTIGYGGDRFLAPESPFAQAGRAATHRNPAERVDFATYWRSQTRMTAELRAMRGVGALKVGARANLLILNQDPYAVAPEQIAATRPLVTVSDGKVVYSDGTLAPATP
ncbi:MULTISPECIES: amidohydrolase family protein [unclassified Corallococcus]|uniref:amidohydrolase family protein n=1 Tax=unclassified Corallococcus TaxID=2685029 RepID=UPI001A8EC9D7|nr:MULTISPECIES: amidohydrolase family protein [unclassified Corallococcus]MBN9687101.1 amidohydrolase family protein [Corallococcus sp. NCSPR001]WAS89071.1 amidohydrolase family protein [Corallococcus sp. NCRR]